MTTDNEAPYYTSCPEDKFVETTEDSARVLWKIPEFLDNSNRTPIVDHNKNSGEKFYLGEVFVYYVAKDQSGNVNDSCAFKVHVKGKLTVLIIDSSGAFEQIQRKYALA